MLIVVTGHDWRFFEAYEEIKECVSGPQEKNGSVGKIGFMYMKRKCAAVKAKGKLSNLENHFSKSLKASV